MSIQLVVVAKPELFESGQLKERYYRYFQELKSFSFPSDIDFDDDLLASLTKQLFFLYWNWYLGEEIFGNNMLSAEDLFDRYWSIQNLGEIRQEELHDCDDDPVLDLLDVRLDKLVREQFLSMQSDDVRASLEKLLKIDYRPQGQVAGGLLYAETDYFKPFPAHETVFAEDAEDHLKYLLPLATVSLKHINPAWEGVIHFVQPIEPYVGVVGEKTASHHSPLCGENWVGYRMDQHGRYTLATEWDYFLLCNLETRQDFQPSPTDKQELHDHYQEAKQSFRANREHFLNYKALHPSYSLEEYGEYRDKDRFELVHQLGGNPGWGNWPGIGDWPLSTHKCEVEDEFSDNTYPLPQAEDGTDFSYVGWLRSSTYVETSPCNLQLFYHPELRLALTTFDWS